MKVDIKSFLIGVLTTVNLFLLMGFDDHKSEDRNGRYQITEHTNGLKTWYDTRNGEGVGSYYPTISQRQIYKGYIAFEEGEVKEFENEKDFFKYLGERE